MCLFAEFIQFLVTCDWVTRGVAGVSAHDGNESFKVNVRIILMIKDKNSDCVVRLPNRTFSPRLRSVCHHETEPQCRGRWAMVSSPSVICVRSSVVTSSWQETFILSQSDCKQLIKQRFMSGTNCCRADDTKSFTTTRTSCFVWL